MKLNGWTWLIVGIIISAMSGYVYLTIPKNGQPNTAMAFFFFIGIIFIVVGIAKIFFRRMDDKSVLDSIKTDEQPQPKIVTLLNTASTNNLSDIDSKPNKVDETIAQMIQEEQQSRPQVKSQTQAPVVPTTVNDNNPNPSVQSTQKNMHHTNSFSELYAYKGPVHTPSTGTHAQHPVSQHTQQHSAANQASVTHNTPQHHSVQNTAEHSIKCRKCGNANSGSSNYCHQCGNRLK
jgi:hypothetical protein